MGCEGASLSTGLPRLARELHAVLPGYALCGAGAGASPAHDADVVGRVIAGIGIDGGAAYVAMRAWNVLIWQPVMVAVLCAEAEGRVAAVDRSAFRMGPPFGCHLRLLPQWAGDIRPVAAAHLSRCTTAVLDALAQRVRLRRELARRQLADRVLGVLHRRAMLSLAPVAATREAAAGWLAALDLEGLSALEPMLLDDGSEGLWLCRRSCCLEYQVTPDFLCATCPRRARAARITLSREEWQAHV
ncbi:(2Fe-2S)-binding protein [Roseovarius nitratireducens]|uniref:(2Fe-2S)-binding protein n=1 Tax=Roseovarius nitratireducens TaxID=2044597 RepID=UPI000CE1FC05|nr:(2Fe-2S)-binding protein [Roseovarius nitratireducens]